MDRRTWALIVVATVLGGHSASAAAGDERKWKFAATDAAEALAWQAKSRKLLVKLLAIDDLLAADRPRQGRPGIPLKTKVLSTEDKGDYTHCELELNSTPGRRIKAILTVPAAKSKTPKYPAVVCIGGHRSNRRSPYQTSGAYRGFATALAKRRYVTISTDVGHHTVHEKGRTLMGQRLWDQMRVVTYLTTRPDVDTARIGCAGLSLGGEMTMWLGAMDQRISAVVSSGFLTTVANMRRGHCPCWNFPRFTEHFDFADIYSLIAPRPLCCQNGRKEPARGGFPVAIAEGAMREIQTCYKAFSKPGNAVLVAHPAGHAVDLPSCLAFLDKHLRPPQAGTD